MQYYILYDLIGTAQFGTFGADLQREFSDTLKGCSLP